ncbi:hypothetical protein [Winogradskyella immobilis]|uniref:DUF4468 domain-containing protein n=1 Tax=Winogradskyella immobilis TaxID=2816852 RepID=A0ABS8EK81_9FLAO|nr:hypothetical protein [Winogradskyella immobilis]MCC1483426.1 hypothetical protein [Winogradskyella immobilis]MCG0015520.1 hypothetical protein [Winogradskyella immobilis]
MNKNSLLLLFVGMCFYMHSQSKSGPVYVLVKDIKTDKHWGCPTQQTDYEINYSLRNVKDYKRKSKALEVFKKRFQAGEDNTKIIAHEVSIAPDDFLVVYEYVYEYSDRRDEKCSTNLRRIIKGFKVKNLEEIPEKMQERLEANFRKKDYDIHNILEIRVPLNLSDNAPLLNVISGKIRDYVNKNGKVDKTKKNKGTAVGVRG